MATHTFTLGAQGSGTDLGESALRHFKGEEFPIALPDAGATEEETVANLLRSCGGDHKNLRNVFVGQSARLTYQKAIKDAARKLGPRVDLYISLNGAEPSAEQTEKAGGAPISREDALKELHAIATGPVPEHTVRGEGESKPRSASVKKAVDAEREKQVAGVKANLDSMPPKARKAALENIRVLMPEIYERLVEDAEEPVEA